MKALQPIILTINSGSSNVKFAAYKLPDLNLVHSAVCEKIAEVFTWFDTVSATYDLRAVGHRVVFGGGQFVKPVVVTNAILQQLKKLTPLAPLHMPNNLAAIEYVQQKFQQVPQVACFDTAFHVTQLPIAKIFALPSAFAEEGVQHYGFHGLSYQYIASVLPVELDVKSTDKVIVAHLGNGSSMCAMINGRSIATTMGFSSLEGLVMGTRCGRIDPGVLLYLLQEKDYSVQQLQELLYRQSGLLGVSGLSNDVRELIASPAPAAKLALELYAYRAAQELASLLVPLGGCDYIIFTGGIGENAALVRQQICAWLAWMDISIDHSSNLSNDKVISQAASKICVAKIDTNEEVIIAQSTFQSII